jgi:DNA polymerase
MVIGQDWGDTKYFIRNRGRETLRNPTNVTLVKLLDLLDLTVGAPGDTTGQDVVFFTNAVLCLKTEGGLQGKVQDAWFRNCAGYLRRQIEVVGPNVVVGLGQRAFRSILSSFGLRTRGFLAEVENAEGTLLPNGSRVFAVYHCGARIQNIHRSLDAQKKDWARIRRFLAPAG